jgi:hypothetical protein
MNATQRAIQIVQRQWHEAAMAKVISMDDYRRRKWLRTYTWPMPPGRAA